MDNERLLSEQKMLDIMDFIKFEDHFKDNLDELLKAQDAKTTAARDKEWIGGIYGLIDKYKSDEDDSLTMPVETLIAFAKEMKQSLKQLLGQCDDWCNPTCELYDGRICDAASNCDRRQQWKQSLKAK
jgi:hypothetical protein